MRCAALAQKNAVKLRMCDPAEAGSMGVAWISGASTHGRSHPMFAGYARHSLSRRSALELGSAGMAVMLAAGRTLPVAAEDSSTLARHREIVHRLFTDGVNAGDDTVITSLYAPRLATDGAGAT